MVLLSLLIFSFSWKVWLGPFDIDIDYITLINRPESTPNRGHAGRPGSKHSGEPDISLERRDRHRLSICKEQFEVEVERLC